MKTWLVLAIVVAGLAGGGIWYWKHQASDTPDYKTALVTRGDLVQAVTATGQINPVTNITVGSQVSGIISKIYVDFNSPVTNHELVAEIDPSTYKALVAQARGDLASAQAADDLARVEEERANALFTNSILAKSDFDSAVATAHQAEATVLIKQAALDQALANLAYCSIYAPLDGVVLSRNVDVGQTVAASFSAPTLFIIANDLTKMQIDALVSEADIGGIDTNQAVNFTVDAFPMRTFRGVVAQIRNAAQTNQNVVSYDTVITVDNADLKLRPGMTANVSIVTAQKNNALRVPNAAMRFRPPETAPDTNKPAMASVATGGAPTGGGQGTNGPGGGGQHGSSGGKPKGSHSMRTIYVLADAPGGGKTPKPVQVRAGISDGVFTEIVDGLKEGDEVITGQNLSATSMQSGASNPFGGRRGF
ncbi:MAG TPA: efflux RND transporter periplasmic adaptor subunit [Verrucomicrobiae bacterium]|jgi:HlyD family secretion protein|nr:efflux RND transporter periplasmic adaptor subunit [Verrucomicrobiae bacterium]